MGLIATVAPERNVGPKGPNDQTASVAPVPAADVNTEYSIQCNITSVTNVVQID